MCVFEILGGGGRACVGLCLLPWGVASYVAMHAYFISPQLPLDPLYVIVISCWVGS